jgi:hypothetical protein
MDTLPPGAGMDTCPACASARPAAKRGKGTPSINRTALPILVHHKRHLQAGHTQHERLDLWDVPGLKSKLCQHKCQQSCRAAAC